MIESKTANEPVGNRNAFCSFCRKSFHETGPLVEGPSDVYICYACVKVSMKIIEDACQQRGMKPGDPSWYKSTR